MWDAVLIGTNDLYAELGIPGQFADPKVEDAYRKVIAACKKHGKHPGMGGVYDQKLMDKYIGYGASCKTIIAWGFFRYGRRKWRAQAAISGMMQFVEDNIITPAKCILPDANCSCNAGT